MIKNRPSLTPLCSMELIEEILLNNIVGAGIDTTTITIKCTGRCSGSNE